jgi:hypothetical protein
MKMKQEYQKKLLSGSIKNIVSAFKNAKAFIVDVKSKLFNSSIYNFVRDEFKHNSITLYPQSEFINLTGKDDSELYSKFNFFCNDTSGKNQKIFICTLSDFQKLQNQIEQFRKKGNKIVPLAKTYLVTKPKEGKVSN